MSKKIYRVTVVANGQIVHTEFITSEEDLEEAERKAASLEFNNLREYPVQGEVFVEEGDVFWYPKKESDFQPDPVPEITAEDWSRHP